MLKFLFYSYWHQKFLNEKYKETIRVKDKFRLPRERSIILMAEVFIVVLIFFYYVQWLVQVSCQSHVWFLSWKWFGQSTQNLKRVKNVALTGVSCLDKFPYNQKEDTGEKKRDRAKCFRQTTMQFNLHFFRSDLLSHLFFAAWFQ